MSAAKERASDPGQKETLAGAISALAEAMHSAAGREKPSRLPGWIAPVIQSVLPSLVMFVIGYLFVEGVRLDLQREEFTAATAEKLKSYYSEIITADATVAPDKLRATALALGGFGKPAALPLVSIIDFGGEQRMAAAALGLEQAGRVAPATCATMAAVIDDKTEAYRWTTQKTVAEVAGLVGCPEAREPLENLRRAIPNVRVLSTEQKDNFEFTVNQALARIAASERRSR